MASVFGHAFTAFILGKTFKKTIYSWKFWAIGLSCSILPDIDVIGFAFGISYDAFWGHRGFTHSFLFAGLIGIICSTFFYKDEKNYRLKTLLALYFSLCTALHGVLDAMTTGGLGVAFFAPFDNSRYFFPFRPIQVSPIGIQSFFTVRGLNILASELLWIGIPGSILLILKWFLNRINATTSDSK